jgi:hypothetical protein
VVTITDPWDLPEKLGTFAFAAGVDELFDDEATLRPLEPLRYAGASVVAVRIGARHEDVSLSAVARGSVPVSGVLETGDGSVAFIGEVARER